MRYKDIIIVLIKINRIDNLLLLNIHNIVLILYYIYIYMSKICILKYICIMYMYMYISRYVDVTQ